MSGFDLDKQIEMCRHLYDQQISRRDTIRTTLGVPLTALSFAAFGFGALASQISIQIITPWVTAILFAVAFYAVCALMCFLSSVHLIWKIDYSSYVALPDVFDTDEQRARISEAIKTIPYAPAQRKAVVEEAIQEGVRAEFIAQANKLSLKNDKNLEIQSRMLRTIVKGLGCLIFSIFLTLCLKFAPLIPT